MKQKKLSKKGFVSIETIIVGALLISLGSRAIATLYDSSDKISSVSMVQIEETQQQFSVFEQ